jgi:hypothetical protein
MTGVVVTPLDYFTSPNYYRRGFDLRMYPIYAGTYTLSWSAMTRKTGTPSTFNFMVALHDENRVNIYLNNKTYTFSSLGTQNFTETVVISTVSSNRVTLHFNGATDSTAYSASIGAGITNIRF